MSLREILFPKYIPLNRERRDGLCRNAKYLQLVDFVGKEPEPFAEYCTFQKRNDPHLYSTTPEEELREKYKAWTEYLKNWFGFMENNEIVSISPMSGGDFANTILLKKLSKSKRTDDEEIAIAIFSELSLFRKEIQLWCKVLALRTVIIPEDPILIELGERPGTYHNTVNLGLWNTGKELLRFKIMNDGIMIHDVHFRFKSFS